MPIQFIAGDLFVNRLGAEAFAHGCNCQGSMGAGIATGFSNRYPEMYFEDQSRCKSRPRLFNPGDVFFWRSTGQQSVFNLATQEHYRGRQPASIPAVRQSLVRMREIADIENIKSIAMPRIGAGLGGLDWNDVKSVIHDIFYEWDGRLIVYEDFAQDPL